MPSKPRARRLGQDGDNEGPIKSWFGTKSGFRPTGLQATTAAGHTQALGLGKIRFSFIAMPLFLIG